MASGLENIETVESPFRRFVTTIGVFPTAFTDAMTYYECLAYLVKYMEETLIPAINENAEALKELQALYVQLKKYVDDYFENLDVQEEINNKLDQMVEDGTLQEIITQYIQANTAWYFNTVADMKNAENLINGSFVRTLGYHSINDGGEATYKIRTITNDDIVDEASIIAVHDDSLIAELVDYQNINVKQFGAYGDNSHDDTQNIQKAINFAETKRGVVYFPNGLYLISDKLEIHKTVQIRGLAKTGITNDDIVYGAQIKQTVSNKDIFYFTSANYGSVIENIRLSADNDTNKTCIAINSDSFYSEAIIRNVSFLGQLKSAIKLVDVGDVLITSCYFASNDTAIDIVKGNTVTIKNNNFWINNIDIKLGQLTDSYITENWFESTDGTSIGLMFQAPSNLTNCVIDKNAFLKVNTCVKFDGTTNITSIMSFRQLTFRNNRFTGASPWIIDMKNSSNVTNVTSGNYWNITVDNCLFNNVTSGQAIDLDYDALGGTGFHLTNCKVFSGWASGSTNFFTAGQTNTAPINDFIGGYHTNGAIQFDIIANYQLRKNNSMFMDSAHRFLIRDNDGAENQILVNKNGTTANRPATAYVGEMYYDKTLFKPLWWSGSAWVDVNGNPA